VRSREVGRRLHQLVVTGTSIEHVDSKQRRSAVSKTMNGTVGLVAWVVVAWLLGGGAGSAQDAPEGAGPSLLAAAESEARRQEDAQAPATTPARRPAASQPREPGAIPRPRLAGSTTGYVDNGFIGSQVRMRFDAGWGLASPDRAEFFYAKCGCYRLAGIDPEAAGPVPPFTGTDPTNVPLIENDLDYRDLQFYGEYALHPRFSVFADAPIRSLSPSIIPEATGIGDVRAGFKLGLVASDTAALTFQFRGWMPSGDSEKGLGTNHGSLDFGVLYSGIVNERVSIGAELGSWHALGGPSALPVSSDQDWAGDVVRWAFGAGIDLVGRPDLSFAPVVEVFGWHVASGYVSVTPDGTPGKLQVLEADGTDIVNLKLGGRATFGGRHSIYVGYGFPISDAHWYDDIVRVEYRLAF
jgi:hypothetical protein